MGCSPKKGYMYLIKFNVIFHLFAEKPPVELEGFAPKLA